ncbi:MAG: helix-turn-helix transcriptional regulator [Planctomycetes bacterium]|nr:helix-turn-helix transcriptional regulator [Planctomycetota bacterium]
MMQLKTFPIQVRELTYREAGRDYYVEAHDHVYYQWYCVLKSEVQMCCDGVTYHLTAGQCIIIPPGTMRSPRSDARAPYYMISMFDSDALDITGICGKVLTLTQSMLQMLDGLIADLQEPDFGNAEDYRHAVLSHLFIDLRRRQRQGSIGHNLPRLNDRARREVVVQAEEFMRAQLHNTLSRNQIAAAVHFSAPHLARIFKASIDRTINQRLTELRLERAKYQLIHSTFPITKIAGEVGFQSFSHFAKLFQRDTGMTPSDYRARDGLRYVTK